MNRREHGYYDAPSHRETILVTGGAGYIGSLLVPRLLSRGCHVRVLDRLLYGDDGLRNVLNHPHFELIAADFRDIDVVMKATDGVDAVIHLGAIVGDAACDVDPDFTVSTNLDATNVMVEACRMRHISRLVFVSTCSVYGASKGVIDEESALNPVSLYARTKITSEQILLDEVSFGFSPIILRLGTAYGISHRPRFDLVVNLLTAQALTEGKISIHGGEQWRPFIHVEDIARALVLALEAPIERVAGQIFNIGANEHNHQLSELGQLIGEIIPTTEVVTMDNVVDLRNYYVSFDKAREVLGFYPTRNLRSGVHEMKAAIESGLVSHFRDRHHHNHLWLKELPLGSWQSGTMANALSAIG